MAVNMVFWPPLEASWMGKIRDLGVDVHEVRSEAEALARIADADALYGRVTPALLAAAKKLRWVQSSSVGLDRFFFPELRASSITVTNVRGIFSDSIAEHVLAFILSFASGMHIYVRRQMEGRWSKADVGVIDLEGTSLGIIGLGGIGLAVAERGRAFGMRILGVDPAPKATPDYIETIWGPERLHEMLREADFVVICVPHTPETEYMIDTAALNTMKRSAILINVGRGKVVHLAALTRALEVGGIGGAGLDVFEEEPLPEEHPLWGMENVMITPHAGGGSPRIGERRCVLVVENVRRFCKGERLLNVVDKQKGYVVEPNP